jgi:hypothetical protein
MLLPAYQRKDMYNQSIPEKKLPFQTPNEQATGRQTL